MKPDHPEADCPMILLLDRVANKWAVLIVAALWKRPLRFNALRRTVGGISQKMLSQTLKGLERDGLVSRTVTPSTPVTVEYAITELGKTLAIVMDELRVWSADHIDDVIAAREAYDKRPGVQASLLP
ncbi:MAG: helix-turn-helix domain-containing protein [Hyphomonas sp.]|nr:helix-turn-helix transcriptional regulator [Hyphomonas sp.]MCB9962059.1 helix-turn-helix transcriptional regulator [Hyphomonas sp.]MCB9971051.1 helix-turn-helix transcriptional regulator [Hyphomonas sp.]